MTAPLMEQLDVEVEPLDSLFGIDAARLPEPVDEFRERGAELRLAWAAAADSPPTINLLRARNRQASKTMLARAAVVTGVAAGLVVGWRVQSRWSVAGTDHDRAVGRECLFRCEQSDGSAVQRQRAKAPPVVTPRAAGCDQDVTGCDAGAAQSRSPAAKPPFLRRRRWLQARRARRVAAAAGNSASAASDCSAAGGAAGRAAATVSGRATAGRAGGPRRAHAVGAGAHARSCEARAAAGSRAAVRGGHRHDSVFAGSQARDHRWSHRWSR